MESTNKVQLTCEEILKLIRASKSFNLQYIKYGDLHISRQAVSDRVDSADTSLQADSIEESAEVLNELEEFEKENLLITDPLEYEKKAGNG